MKTALITGASSGLGVEFAQLFAKGKHNVILVARSKNKLNELKEKLEDKYSIRAYVLDIDLSKVDAGKAVFEFTKANNVTVDILVNNAGFGDFGEFSKAEWQKQYEMVALNITALMQLTHCFLPGMISRRSGKILNVASVASFQPGPLMSVYCATKSFVLSFSEALAEELCGSGVTVTALCPGPTKTGFEKSADLDNSGLFSNLGAATADEVAEYGYEELFNGTVVAVPGIKNNILTFSNRLVPKSVVRKISHFIMKGNNK